MTSPDFENTDFDGSERAAWSLFAEELAQPLAILKRHEFIELARIDVPGGYRLLMTFTLTGSGRLRCAIDAMAFGSSTVPGWAPARPPRHLVLPGLGWRKLRNDSWIHEVGKRGAGKLINAALRALWQVVNVENPSVLTVRYPFGEHAEALPSFGDLFADLPLARPSDPEPRRSPPNAADELLAKAGAVMSARFGERVTLEKDRIRFLTEDGFGTTILVAPGAQRLEFCTTLAHEVPSMDLLGAVVAEHSARWPNIAIVVNKGHVFAVRPMEAAVFHPVNLRAAVADWEDFCRDGAIDIIEQLRPAGEDDMDCLLLGPVPERLITMVERYSRGERSGLTPDEIVRSTRGNTPLLRRYARHCADEINQMQTLEQAGVAAGISTHEIARCRRQRQAVESFMPILVTAITLAAQYNDEWGMGQCG